MKLLSAFSVVLAALVLAAHLRADEAAKDEPPISDADREHWAFRPLDRPFVPEVNDSTWCRNPIDRFVLARLEAAGLAPSPPADRVTLIRRVTFDLTGLPPTPEEVDRFLADDSPDAYERLLDRLLASPAYGQRWAQHWLDLARFAESDGFEHDHVRPEAWKYRDWVIGALNNDLPYDQFVRLQIAGDLLRPGDESAAIATGFALCGPDMTDINLVEERRHMVLNDMTATVGSVFLGLQIGCAECHNHKYDPLSQADFYRLRAYFEDGLHIEQNKQPPRRVLHEPSDSEPHDKYLYVRGDFRRPGPHVAPAPPRIAALAASQKMEHPKDSRTALADWLTRPITSSPRGSSSIASGSTTSAAASSSRRVTSAPWAKSRPTPICSTGSPPNSPALAGASNACTA